MTNKSIKDGHHIMPIFEKEEFTLYIPIQL